MRGLMQGQTSKKFIGNRIDFATRRASSDSERFRTIKVPPNDMAARSEDS